MLILYYTHSILFYLGLPTFQMSNNDFKKSLLSIDYEYLPEEVCVAKCLERFNTVAAKKNTDIMEKQNNQTLKNCADTCSSNKAINQTESYNLPPKQISENYSFNLVCRDDNSLHFKIDLYRTSDTYQKKLYGNRSTEIEAFASATKAYNKTNTEMESKTAHEHECATLFVIKIHLANEAEKIFVYLSDENFITIDKLMANTTYNISVLAVHSNNKYSVIAQQQQFQTLRRGYTPGNVAEIKITHFTEDKHNKMHLTATLTWKPAADMTCHYNIICFSPEIEDYDLQPLEIRNPRQLYKHDLENLTFSSEYKVGIRASNTKSMRESELFWKTFTVPSCAEWHNYNFNICAPEAPKNLYIEHIIVDQHVYSLNVSWQLPTHLPDNYTLRIHDLLDHGETKTYHLPKDAHNYFIRKIYLYGMFYEVSLIAYTGGGHATSSLTDVIKTVVHVPEKNPFVKLIAVILAPIFCLAILSLTIFIIYHRRAKLKRYQERCKYFEELEKKAPIDPKHNFDVTASLKVNSTDILYQMECQENLLHDDDMEIDCKDLILYQVLGEGAFGLVKLGLYKDRKLGTTQQVAVKMLKDHPSADDIYAFRKEIEVMKSVEKHPNIVGIIGHCTRFSNQMMLITEYCSFGNLLNFLRNEWHFVHKLQMEKQFENTSVTYTEINQEDDNNQQQLRLDALSGELSKTYKPHGNDNDGNEIDYFNTHNESDNVIERFKIKYNEINVTAISNNNNSNNNKNSADYNDMKFTHKETKTHDIRKTSILNAQAKENKSYGYHGFCTSSCKCNVDVIVGSIDSSVMEKRNAKLKQILLGEEKQQQQYQLQQYQHHILNKTATTVHIRNCDCKMKAISYDNNAHKFNGAVENKSYFKIFKSDNTFMSRKNQRNIKATKLQHKTKTQTLAKSTPVVLKRDLNDNGTNYWESVPLSGGDLLNIARQVAVGMEFLAKNKVVHRDLAARNVLVAPDRTIKIADFGLSRDVYQENMYKKTGNGKLPIKWLALESMTHQVYTSQSDVWSYGILLYEIITLGATPYPSIPTNHLLHLLKSGYRMEKPKACNQELYDLMYSCWHAEPIVRPTFNNIIQKLDEMLACLNDPKDSTTISSQENNDLNSKQESTQNVSSDEAYLNPL